MAHPEQRPTEGDRDAKKGHPRPSVEYNLEKAPLQTGNLAPRTDLRGKAALAPGEWTARRRMAGWLAVIIMAIVLAIGAIVIFDLHRWLARVLRFE
ncbi:MAG: hypothetical protein WED34_03165 [Planctomycetales bacterium]